MKLYFVEQARNGKDWWPILIPYESIEAAQRQAQIFEQIAVGERLPARFRAVAYSRARGKN